MLEVTSQANSKLVEYMQENNITSALRVFISEGGCSGPALALALDEEKQGDQVFNQNDLVILVEQNIIDQCGSITVDYVDAGNRSGFSIQPANPLPGGGGCSSGSCGSEGCGC